MNGLKGNFLRIFENINPNIWLAKTNKSVRWPVYDQNTKPVQVERVNAVVTSSIVYTHACFYKCGPMYTRAHMYVCMYVRMYVRMYVLWSMYIWVSRKERIPKSCSIISSAKLRKILRAAINTTQTKNIAHTGISAIPHKYRMKIASHICM
jgi:hypothetical protein